ncbi:MAG TPA: hypothetical protein VGP22_07720 [Albitalea sp.]|nr:hypothetical protein [Albitalea sp.]
MTDEYQIEIPPSFYALYTDERKRLTAPLRTVRERYEACEDLAQHLVEHANDVHRGIGVPEDEVLARCLAGLKTPEAGVSEPEAVWVITRLAELVGWPLP